MSNRKKFLCIDCGVDTGKIGEHYMLNDSVWLSAVNSKRGMLCVGCIETRLARKLKTEDFNKSHVNIPAPKKYFSQRLTDRLFGEKYETTNTNRSSNFRCLC